MRACFEYIYQIKNEISRHQKKAERAKHSGNWEVYLFGGAAERSPHKEHKKTYKSAPEQTVPRADVPQKVHKSVLVILKRDADDLLKENTRNKLYSTCKQYRKKKVNYKVQYPKDQTAAAAFATPVYSYGGRYGWAEREVY